MLYRFTGRSLNDLEAVWQRFQESFDQLKEDIPEGRVGARISATILSGLCGERAGKVRTRRGEILSQFLSSSGVPANLPGIPDQIKTIYKESYGELQGVRDILYGTVADPAGLLDDEWIQTHQGSEAKRVVESRFEDVERQIINGLDEIDGLTTPAGQQATVGEVRDSVNDFHTFPVMVDQVGPSTPSGLGSGSHPGTGLGSLVEGAFRDVLGWRPNPSDPRGLTAALNQAFSPKVLEGRTEYVYRRPTYAVASDLGAVTGAQASVYTRAKVILTEAMPLLEFLEPLIPDSDEQNVDAVRELVRTAFSGLVDELGVEGGPRPQRVETYFETLLGPLPGPAAPALDPTDVGGHLGALREELGLEPDRANTIDEERNYTNFVIIVDYVNALWQNWSSQLKYFDRSGTDAYLGTQLVLISRTLGSLAESVQEAESIMNSVFLGPAERQTTKLDFGDQTPPLFLAELLDWVMRVATAEAPASIRASGKRGVTALIPTLTRLRGLVTQSLVPPQNQANLPVGYGRPRVQRAMREIESHLIETLRLVSQINPVGRRA